MLQWAILFLIMALIAGIFGFWGLEGTAKWFEQEEVMSERPVELLA